MGATEAMIITSLYEEGKKVWIDVITREMRKKMPPFFIKPLKMMLSFLFNRRASMKKTRAPVRRIREAKER